MTEAMAQSGVAHAASPSPSSPRPDDSRFDGHDPFSLFGIVQPPEGETRMTPGPWLVDASGRPRGGTHGLLAEVGWGMRAFRARPDSMYGGTTSSLSLEFLPGTDWFDHGDLVTVSELMYADVAGALVRGEIRSGSGDLLAFGTLNNRNLLLPEPWEPDFGISRESDPTIGLSDILDIHPVTTEDGSSTSFTAPVWLGNIFGGLQGGVVMVLVELAASTALIGEPHGWEPTSMRVDFHRPATVGEALEVRSTRRQSGRTMAVVEVVIAKPDGKRAVTGTVSYAQTR
jgi:acyl-coenzyme A thioesterase PaaI-like protein